MNFSARIFGQQRVLLQKLWRNSKKPSSLYGRWKEPSTYSCSQDVLLKTLLPVRHGVAVSPNRSIQRRAQQSMTTTSTCTCPRPLFIGYWRNTWRSKFNYRKNLSQEPTSSNSKTRFHNMTWFNDMCRRSLGGHYFTYIKRSRLVVIDQITCFIEEICILYNTVYNSTLSERVLKS